MSNYLLRFVANNIVKVVGVKRLANYVALSIGPKIIDQAVNVATKGYVPVRAVRVLRTSLSYAPLAVVMGTGGTSLVTSITYYILIQISETVCMMVVREAASRSFQGIKYICKATYNGMRGGANALEHKEEEMEEWVFIEKPGLANGEKDDDIKLSSEQIKELEQYAANIDIDEYTKIDQQSIIDASTNETNNNSNNKNSPPSPYPPPTYQYAPPSPIFMEEHLKKEIDDFVFL
ncbi:hypothetical protein DFA_07152 [Cavenderia fasciculata]|uniref:Transmembrane protein n=1 Tax=Cavenderia fasciculata TaxID=261658 RepID=F4PVM2_CACFS|nr:uncharacterized protein DFA_07152 [Cavenderia fasciculata]EGG20036.1 hypothetical protein DFA_07152 [Cavenderia fasciculata]|eukprot:XP_004367019.1 hypothetical protein DFA_07152 [Cavenderia fasciculata]